MSQIVLDNGALQLPRRGGFRLLVGFVAGSLALHGAALVLLHTRPASLSTPQRPVELVMVEVQKPPPPPPEVKEEPKPEPPKPRVVPRPVVKVAQAPKPLPPPPVEAPPPPNEAPPPAKPKKPAAEAQPKEPPATRTRKTVAQD